MRAAAFAIACLLPAGVTDTPSPGPAPAAASPSPATPSPTPPSSSIPSPTPSALPTVLMLPPDAPPQILWVGLSATKLRLGQTVAVTVLTSSNVASVEMRIEGYGAALVKSDVGHFAGSTRVPRLPMLMGRKFTLRIIARNTAGVPAEQDVTLQVRLATAPSHAAPLRAATSEETWASSSDPILG